jgi:predicted Rossmann fold nucleotide-binding protein DprA/Smf involved in DNA uptake
MASPFGPDTPYQAGNAMGRNKIIYALSRVTFVADSDKGSGGTWAGATEALDKGYAAVAVWAGKGAREGNEE